MSNHFELTAADRELLRRVRERLDAGAPKVPAAAPPAMQPPAALARAVQPPAEEAESDKKRRPTPTERLYEVAKATGIELFSTPSGEAYAMVTVDGRREVLPVPSDQFDDWLVDVADSQLGMLASPTTIAVVMKQFRSKARKGAKREVFLRVAGDCQAGHLGKIFVDLADKERRVVEITAEGWRIITDPPVCFVRPAGMLPLPVPERGGHIDELRSLVNIPDESDWCLLLGWMLGALNPAGPYPVLAITGEPGAGKSTLARMIRELVDPNVLALRHKLRDERDVAVAARRTWVLALDNLSSVPTWLSDTLCCVATGGGFSTRELYTDGGEAIFTYRRPIVITSIADVIVRSDLADRAVRLELPHFAGAQRCEADVWEDFRQAHARILGTIFSAISGGMRLLPEVPAPKGVRMTDFARWAEACCRACGFAVGAFGGAYGRNRQGSAEMALDASPIASVLRAALAKQPGGTWRGTATQLLAWLEVHADEKTRKSRQWPGSPIALGGQLHRAAPHLRRVGITIEFRRTGQAGSRIVEISSPMLSVPSADDASPCGDRPYMRDNSVSKVSARRQQGVSEVSACKSKPHNGLRRKADATDNTDNTDNTDAEPSPSNFPANGNPNSHSGAVRAETRAVRAEEPKNVRAWIAPGLREEDVRTPFDASP